MYAENQAEIDLTKIEFRNNYFRHSRMQDQNNTDNFFKAILVNDSFKLFPNLTSILLSLKCLVFSKMNGVSFFVGFPKSLNFK